MRGTQNNGDGTTVTWRDQSWQENSAPYDRRQVETTPTARPSRAGTWGRPSRSTTRDEYDLCERIDPTRRQRAQAAQSEITRTAPGPTAYTYTARLHGFRVSPGHGSRPCLAAAEASSSPAARRRRSRKAPAYQVGPCTARRQHPQRAQARVVPAAAATTVVGLRRLLIAGLRRPDPHPTPSGGAHLVGHATIGGRDTLEIRSQDGHTTYYVDANSYSPVDSTPPAPTAASSCASPPRRCWLPTTSTRGCSALLRSTLRRPSTETRQTTWRRRSVCSPTAETAKRRRSSIRQPIGVVSSVRRGNRLPTAVRRDSTSGALGRGRLVMCVVTARSRRRRTHISPQIQPVP